jgi:hypothetical protein
MKKSLPNGLPILRLCCIALLTLRVLAHELGHQFGATHSFNGTTGNCSQRTANTAYESGSGLTLMS